MQFDFTGAEQFLDYLAGKVSVRQILDHPAYQTVCRHAELFSMGVTQEDIENALRGRVSSFYGTESLFDNLSRIQTLLTVIREQETTWVATVESVLRGLFPGEDMQITIYPIIGYDMGIGLNGAVCLNCNTKAYLDQPVEFLFFIIHECVHVIYERYHRVKPLSEIITPVEWSSYFTMWAQNEGYAVYAPFRLRSELGYLAERDYCVLSDKHELGECLKVFSHALERLQQTQPLERDEYLEICFGPRRLTYRIGCELIRRIEREHGMEAVQNAFTLDGEEFINRYKHLLEAGT
jgi:hypothetical protein